MEPRELDGAVENGAAHTAPYMSVSVENFGPVSSGAVDLRPLTIFIGPNNSGKSYMSMLIHSILSTENDVFPPASATGDHWLPPSDPFKDFTDEALACVKKYGGDGSLEGFYVLERKIKAYVREFFDGDLGRQIAVNFGSSLSALVRYGQSAARVSVDGGFTASLSNGLRVVHDPQERGDPDNLGALADELHVVMEGPVPGTAPRGTYDRDLVIARRMLRVLAASALKSSRVSGAPPDSFYFPAARSGLLQGHKALSAGLIQGAQLAGTLELRVPRLTGVVSDFITQIIRMPSERGDFYDLAAEMESEMLKGSIDLRISDGSFPEIFYRTAANAIPLHRTSSTISEVAPLSLYLKHVAVPGSLLVIEEPEAHLHLANQEAMARYIVRMVRAGLRVLVTTHSSAIVDEISTYMSASRASREERTEAGLDHGDWVTPDEVAPYAFEGSFESGYSIREIRKDPETGIPHEDYVDVLESMFNRSAKLEHVVAARRHAG